MILIDLLVWVAGMPVLLAIVAVYVVVSCFFKSNNPRKR